MGAEFIVDSLEDMCELMRNNRIPREKKPMNRYTEDCKLDAIKDKMAEDAEARKWARRDYCGECSEHNDECPYYDPEEETFDCDQCFEDKGW